MKSLSLIIDGQVIDCVCENCWFGEYDTEGFWCDKHEKEVSCPNVELCKYYKLKLEVENFEEL